MKKRLLWGAWLLLSAFHPSAAQVRFSDISDGSKVQGLLRNGCYVYGHGVAIADISGDGLPDIYVANAAEGTKAFRELLYISHSGKAYSEEAYDRGVTDTYGIGSHGIVFFDMDNDGDFDLYNGNTSQPKDGVLAINRLYLNTNGMFEDWTSKGALSTSPVGSRSVIALDINRDGYMDLYSVGSILPDYEAENNQLYINQGNRTFKLENYGLASVNAKGFGPNGVTAADVNDDGYPEIYVSRVDRVVFGTISGVRAANQFFFRQANGTYVDRVHELKTAGSGWSDGATFCDFDTDGDLDLFVSSSNDEKLNKLFVYRNDGAGNFDDITNQINIDQRGFSNLLFDADNDGDFDLYAISDSSADYCNRLYLNDGHGNFTMKSGTGLEVDYKDARGAGVADFDNDGDLDLYVTDTNKNYQTIYFNHLFRNDTPNTGNRWLKLFGRGPKGDAGAFGSKIWIFDKDGWDDLSRLICHKEIISTYGFCCQDDPVQHFGVGKRDTVAVKIRLTDGTLLRYAKLATNQKITFTKTGAIEKLAGDNQSGRRGVTLTEPIKVRILDASGKPLGGVQVRFESKEGTFIGSPLQNTDALGQAQIQYVVGATSLRQKVTVTCSTIPNVYAEFNVNKISIPKELKLIGSMTPSGMAGEILPDSIKVRVVDEDGAAKPGHPVQFQILNGLGSLFPGSASTTEILTNSSGLATAAWRLGKAAEAYTQQLSVRSRYQEIDLIGSPVTISAQAQFPDTLRLALLDGDKQTGPAGTILPLPLRVQLSTSTGAAAPILSIRFKVISGGGSVSESDSITVTTNSLGVAAVPWRLGSSFTLAQTVLAFLVINPTHQVVFSAVAQPTNSQLHYMGASTLQGQAGRLLTTPIVFRVTDNGGLPIQNRTVFFKVVQGGGKVNNLESVSLNTAANGEAQVLWQLGPQAGKNNQKLFVAADGAAGSPMELSASALAGRAYQLKIKSGDGQSASPLRTLQPLSVQVLDSLQNPVPLHPVTFSVLQGDAKIGAYSTSTAVTDSNGIAQAIVTMNVTPGPIQVQAVAEYNRAALLGSPVIFHATLLPAVPAQLSYSGSLEWTGQVGTALPEIIVLVVDDIGAPVSDYSVLFRVAKGAGKVNGQDSVRIYTDKQGIGRATWKLGPTSGKRNNELVITAAGLQGSPIRLVASAIAGKAYYLAKTAGDAQVGVPRYVLPQPLTTTVTDSLHNPVAGQPVAFQVTVGDANFNGNGQTNTLSDSLGVARATLTLGSQIGAVQVRASAQSAGKELNNSPVLFSATVRVPNPTRLRRTEAEEYVGQTGRVLKSLIIAQVIDELGFPVGGYAITCRVVAGNGKVNDQDSLRLLTDDQGYATCRWRLGPQPGQRNNQLAFIAPALQGSPVMVMASAIAAKAFSMTKVSGDGQSGFVLSSLALPLQVQILDSLQYPVSNHRVTFQIMQGDATLNQSNLITVQSDSDGMARATVNLGTIPGTVQIQSLAESDGRLLQSAPLAFTAQLALPNIDRVRSKVNVDSAVMANGRARVRLQAVLLSPQNRPLPGLHLRFGVSGQANNLVQPQLPTDVQGKTDAYLSSTRAEWKKVWAEILYGATVLDTVRVQFKPGPAAVLSKISGDGQSAPVGMELPRPLVVSLSDSFANPVSGILSLQEIGPNGSTRTLPSQWTDQLGSGQLLWTLGTIPGLYRLVVNHNLLTTTFTATASARVPGQLLLISGNHQTARGGGVLSQPLMVQVLDTQGDPQAGVPLTFQVQAGGGAISPATGVVTDSLGMAQVTWRVGTSGEQRVNVQVSSLNQLVAEFTAQLRSNTVPLLSSPVEITVKEGQAVRFVVTGTDADGDSLTYGVITLPEGASFDPKSHLFTWTPGFHHAGTTKVSFWLQDNFGGRTTAITSINVEDVPVAPIITAHQPMDTLLSMNGKDLSFSVSASDLDGNVLSYSWWLNGMLMASGNKEFILRYRATLPQHSRLAARVTDGTFFVEQVWQLDITNQVLLPETTPSQYALLPNYPNPFNPTTHIPFDVAGNAWVRVLIYDHDGRLVRTLANGRYSIGHHILEWDARDAAGSIVASGLYLCVLERDGLRQTRKLTLMK